MRSTPTAPASNTCACFVYDVDTETEPAINRAPMRFTEVYIGAVSLTDFRRNDRSELGTRTATLGKQGIAKFRQDWVHRLDQT